MTASAPTTPSPPMHESHLRGLERTSDGNTLALMSGTDYKPEVSRRNASALRKLLSDLA